MSRSASPRSLNTLTPALLAMTTTMSLTFVRSTSCGRMLLNFGLLELPRRKKSPGQM